MVAIVAGKTQPCQLITDTLVCASKLAFKASNLGLIPLCFRRHIFAFKTYHLVIKLWFFTTTNIHKLTRMIAGLLHYA